MRYLKLFYIKHFTDRWVWRVEYPDGKRTRLLGKIEAKSLKEVHGGRLYMDDSVI
jgi:hypothetical protein